VVIDRSKLKKPARDDILIAMAGPLSNLLFALVLVVVLKAVISFVPLHTETVFRSVLLIFLALISTNISLGLFNLLPLPPLDGSHLILNLLSQKSTVGAALFFRYGSYALLAIVLIERFAKIDILPIGRMVNAVVAFLLRSVGLY
jgi:Zn-dependent protease